MEKLKIVTVIVITRSMHTHSHFRVSRYDLIFGSFSTRIFTSANFGKSAAGKSILAISSGKLKKWANWISATDNYNIYIKIHCHALTMTYMQ